ncbi:MAG: hypothetical protein ACTSXU_12485, partial [Promethearchaeota archaeon]
MAKDLYSEVKRRKMEALGKAKIVKAVEKHGKILTIRGEYDQPAKVLKHAYAAVKDDIDPRQVNKVNLNNYDLVVIGCSGKDIPTNSLMKFNEYVNNGGWLLSTDWVLKTIIEPVFPGYIRWNMEKTADTVVSCTLVDPSHPFLDGVIETLKSIKSSKTKGPKSMHPAMLPTFKWWLEDKSFPIEILRKNEVKVLIESYEIKKKWGASPVFVYFTYGKGLVAHFISHTHLQKGASKGKFASAIILTNLLDECVKWKYGIESGRQRGGYQDTAFNPLAVNSSNSWNQSMTRVDNLPAQQPQGYQPYGAPKKNTQPQQYQQPAYSPSPSSPVTQANPYFQQPEPDPSQGIVPDFGGVAQAIEIQYIPDPSKTCIFCGEPLDLTKGKVYECNS